MFPKTTPQYCFSRQGKYLQYCLLLLNVNNYSHINNYSCLDDGGILALEICSTWNHVQWYRTSKLYSNASTASPTESVLNCKEKKYSIVRTMKHMWPSTNTTPRNTRNTPTKIPNLGMYKIYVCDGVHTFIRCPISGFQFLTILQKFRDDYRLPVLFDDDLPKLLTMRMTAVTYTIP